MQIDHHGQNMRLYAAFANVWKVKAGNFWDIRIFMSPIPFI
jgi:hypothetical protein